jgi:hypothetical protein
MTHEEIQHAIAEVGEKLIKDGKGLEFFVNIAVSIAKAEGEGDAKILERVRKEALSTLAEK